MSWRRDLRRDLSCLDVNFHAIPFELACKIPPEALAWPHSLRESSSPEAKSLGCWVPRIIPKKQSVSTTSSQIQLLQGSEKPVNDIINALESWSAAGVPPWKYNLGCEESTLRHSRAGCAASLWLAPQSCWSRRQDHATAGWGWSASRPVAKCLLPGWNIYSRRQQWRSPSMPAFRLTSELHNAQDSASGWCTVGQSCSAFGKLSLCAPGLEFQSSLRLLLAACSQPARSKSAWA